MGVSVDDVDYCFEVGVVVGDVGDGIVGVECDVVD